LTPRLTTDH